MLTFTDKSQCCGCTACASICPKQCIQMIEDKEGFLYPQINHSVCVDCGLCEKVCPVLHPVQAKEKPAVFAAVNNNLEIRMQSSSGGIFTLLAEQTIQNGGVVFGAYFDEEWNVVHCYTETLEGLSVFRGSKYVQSSIRTSFQDVKRFLGQGRKVLFSGTSCQIAGLKNYLRKSYDTLLTVEVVCHGVPSLKVWKSYLSGKKNIRNINFRSKTQGWKNFRLELIYADGKVEGVEAARQLRLEKGPKNVICVHVTLVPYIAVAQELKTKPTQHSVNKLREVGIEPSMLICRTEQPLSQHLREKLSLFCSVPVQAVIECADAKSIYHVPEMFYKQKVDEQIIDLLGLTPKQKVDPKWFEFFDKAEGS